MSFTDVIKSATSTREDIEMAVNKKAEKLVAESGGTIEAARTRVWTETGAYAAYERAPIAITKAERPTVKITKSAAELDDLARKIQKADPKLTYHQAYGKAMIENPQLYSRHCIEEQAGAVYPVPAPEWDPAA